MSVRRRNVAALVGLFAGPAALAGVISFSFSPPTSGGTMTNIANAGGVDTGLLVFNQNAPLNFSVDGTNEGFGVVNFPNARLSMSMALSPAQDLGGGLFTAALQGTFAIYDFTGGTRSDIIVGTVSGGTFLHFAESNVILLNSNTGLSYSAGPRLSALLAPGRTLAAPQDGTFALSNVRNSTGGTEILGPGGVFQTFFANTAFTGSSNVIPTPGAIVLAAAGGLVVTRRRR
jgi:hypothetical protein